MKHLAGVAFALLLVVTALSVRSHSQEEPKCHALDANEAKELLPEIVWLRTGTIPVDMKNFTGLQFLDKTRVAIAPLITSGDESGIQKKFAFVLVSETRLGLGNWTLPSGIFGLSVEQAEPKSPTVTLVARDFSGVVIERVCLFFDASMSPVLVGLIPRCENEFELRIGSYAI